MLLKEIVNAVHPMSQEAIEMLEEYTEECSFSKGRHLVSQGKRCNDIFFIKSGLLRCYYSGEGKEDTRWFATAGDVVTSITSYHTSQPALFSIEAISEVNAYCVSFQDIKELFKTNREIYDWAFKCLLEQLYVLERRYMLIGTGDANSRYQAFLKARPKEMIQKIPLKYIAQYLKISQETLSRIRSSIIN